MDGECRSEVCVCCCSVDGGIGSARCPLLWLCWLTVMLGKSLQFAIQEVSLKKNYFSKIITVFRTFTKEVTLIIIINRLGKTDVVYPLCVQL